MSDDAALREQVVEADAAIVHYDSAADAWFFWDETWAHREGPFKSRTGAEQALAQYVEWLG